jgi:hypothetical protein
LPVTSAFASNRLIGPESGTLDVDFEVVSSVINVEPTYLRQMQSGKLSEEQLLEMVELYNNIGKEYCIILQPVK